MAVFKRGSVYWFEFRFRGVRIRESTHSSNKGIADRIERERRRDLELSAAGLRKIGGPLSVTHAVEAYRRLREPHWADRTRGVHQSSWQHLEPFFGKLLLSDAEELAKSAAAAGVHVTVQAGEGLPHVYPAMLGTPDRKSTRLNSSHIQKSRMPSSA